MTEATARALGDLVRRARQGHKMSIREAARRADISEGRLRQIESGVQKVGSGTEIPVRTTPRTLRAVADAVGLDVAEAFQAAGLEPPDEPVTLDEITDPETYIRSAPGFTDAEKEAMLATYRAIRDATPPASAPVTKKRRGTA